MRAAWAQHTIEDAMHKQLRTQWQLRVTRLEDRRLARAQQSRRAQRECHQVSIRSFRCDAAQGANQGTTVRH